MKMSDQTNELFAALSVFQGQLEHAKKDISKKGLSYKYADLAGCIDTAKPVLAANGLAVVQMMGSDGNGQTLITVLTHKSGQYISSETPMPNGKLQGAAGSNPVQVLGSVITYMRRYAFAAITGMAQEDDDGCISGQQGNQKSYQQKQNQIQLISESQQVDLKAVIEENRFSLDQVLQYFNIKSLSEVPANQYQNIINTIKGWVK